MDLSSFDFFLTSNLFTINDDSILELFDGEIPPASNAKVLKIKHTKKISSFIKNLGPGNFPNLFIFVVYDDELDERAMRKVKGQLEEKFAGRSIVLELRDEETKIYIKKENEKFESDDEIVWFIEMLKFDETSRSELVEQVLDSKNPLLLKLLKVFDLDIKLSFLICEYLIENSDDLWPLFEAMDMEFDANGPKVTQRSKEMISYHCNGASILRSALEKKREGLIIFILSNFKKNFDCWDLEHKKEVSAIAHDYPEELKEIFPLMIQNNFPYPDNFDEKKFENCSKEILRDQKNLHETFERSAEEFTKLINEIYCGRARKVSNVCYDSQNEPLLKKAFDRPDNFKLFALLKARGYSAGHKNREIKDSMRKLSDAQKAEIDNKILSLALPHDRQHAKILASKSKVHDRGTYSSALHRKHSEKIEKFFGELSLVPEMKNILRVVSEAELDVEIHFDFNESYIHEILVDGEDSYGQAYPNGRIVVGAKGTKIAVRTLAHELTHLAMRIRYENNWMPFKFGDTSRIELYKKVVEECRNNSVHELYERNLQGEENLNFNVSDQIVPIVFTGYVHSQDLVRQFLIDAETIVRAPEMIVNFKDDPESENFRRCKDLYPRLFNYFKLVLDDLEPINFDGKSMQIVKSLNRSFGQLSKCCIKVHERVKKINPKGPKIVVTNAPKVAMAEIRQKFAATVEREVLFVSAKRFLLSPNIFDEHLRKIQGSMPKIVVNVSKLLDREIQEIFRILNVQENQEIIIVTRCAMDFKLQSINSNTNQLFDLNLTTIIANYSWSDLTPETKGKLLAKKFKFQGREILLSDVINAKLQLSENFLTNVLSKENLIVNNFEAFESFHLSRNFLKKTSVGDLMTEKDFEKLKKTLRDKIYESDSKNVKIEFKVVSSRTSAGNSLKLDFNNLTLKSLSSTRYIQKIEVESLMEHEIIERSKDLKYVLISSDAGTGKSQSLKVMRQLLTSKNPLDLIYLIELNTIVNELSAINENVNFKKFFMANFASKSGMEENIFAHFYDHKKLFILFDGFDEISPSLKFQALALFKSFEAKNGSQLWVTSRSYLETELCDELGIKKVFSLCPFNDEDQTAFLADYWSSQEVESENLQNLAEELAKRIVEGAQNKDKLNLLRDPQILTLFADACIVDGKVDENFVKNFTKHSIYEKHLMKQIQKWSRTEAGILMNANQVRCSSFKDIHRLLALQNCRVDVEEKFDLYRDDLWTNEEIYRIGIVKSFNGNFSIFKHESFKEYFVADFIIDGLTKSGEYLRETLKLLVNFLEQSEEFHVINMFISGGLRTVDERKFSDRKIEQIAKALEEITSSDRRFLTNSLLQNYQTLYELLIKIFSKMNRNAKFAQLKRELTFVDEIEKIKIPNERHNLRLANYSKKMEPLINDEEFNDDESDELKAKLEELLRDLRIISPIGQSLSKIMESLNIL